MKLRATGLVLLGLLLLNGTRPTAAQTIYTPVTVTGFTDDIVANGQGPAATSTTNPTDQGTQGVRYCYVAPTYISPTGVRPVTSLPATGLVNSVLTPGLTFQLASYSASNSLRIAGTGTGSLILATPQATQSVWVAGATGNGQSSGTPVNMTVAFTDGTTQTFVTNVPDWFGGTGYAIQGLSRINRDLDVFDNTVNEPKIYQFQLALLPTNYGRLVQGVTFAKTQPVGAAVLNVFNGLAVTLSRTCGLPVGSLTAAATTVCPGTAVPLTLVPVGPVASGYVGQWQASVDAGVTWTDIAGATTATYTATPLVTTQYRLRVACGTTLGFIGPVTVTVAIPTASIAYDNAAYCRVGQSAAPVVAPTGGTFAGPSGLVLSPSTGVIDLAASTAGTYAVTYTSPTCGATATVSVLIKSDALPTFPNVMTPNKDGYNDVLLLKISDVTDYHLRVFNRWGRRVYEGRDAKQGWTAADNSAGTYLYQVEYTDCAGHRQLYKGWIDVVK